MALAWRETVPDTVPFARLLRDVMLTTLRDQHVSVSRSLQLASPFNSVYRFCPAHVRPSVARDCHFQVKREEARFWPHSRPARCLQQRLWPHGSAHTTLFKATLIHRICLRSNGGVLNGCQMRGLIAFALHLGTLQTLLKRTAVTVLHSSIMHQHPTPALTASSHPLCTPSERQCGVVQY